MTKTKKKLKPLSKKPPRKALQKLDKTEYKASEFKYPRNADKSGKKWPKEMRRRYILEIGEKIGLYNLSKEGLAKKFGVSRTQLYLDLDQIYKMGVPKDYLQHSQTTMPMIYDSAISELHRSMINASQKIRSLENPIISRS